MIIFIYGSDSYRSLEKLNEIIGYYKKSQKNGVNFKILDLKEKDFQVFRDEINSTSIFRGKKLIVLKNAFLNKNFKEGFLNNYKNFINLEDVILFYEDKEILQNDELFKLLNKYGKCQEFKTLDGQKFNNWIKKEFDRYGVDAGEDAIEKLIEYKGTDLWAAANEIKKIASYGGSGRIDNKKGKKIGVKDVELLVSPEIDVDIFKTIDAIASKNKKYVLKLINKHLEKGDPPLYLFSMMISQFRNLLIVKNLVEKNRPYYSILKLSKLHPFVAKKSYFQAKNFTFQELKKIYQKFLRVDLAIKKGKVEPETALNLLITEL